MTNQLVDDYVGRLRRETTDFPRGDRREIVEEIEGHIREALAERPGASEGEIRNALARIGEPDEIAAEGRARLGIPTPRFGGLEIAALILLPVGGVVAPLIYLPIGRVVAPIIAWVVGVILLWISPAWTVREKLAGTLIVPGGLSLPLTLLLLPNGHLVCPGNMQDPQLAACHPSISARVETLLGALAVLLIVATIVTPVVLARRLRARTA